VLVLNIFFNMSYRALRLQVLRWSPREGGSESKTHRPEFISSQVSNPVPGRPVSRAFPPSQASLSEGKVRFHVVKAANMKTAFWYNAP
jgi:hypothetical protein